MAVRVHYNSETVNILVSLGRTVGDIKDDAGRLLMITDMHYVRLVIKNTGLVLFDDELIENVPGLTPQLVTAKLDEIRSLPPPSPSPPPSPPPRATPCSISRSSLNARNCFSNLDDSQFEVLKDQSVLGPPYEGPQWTAEAMAHKIRRHQRFRALLKANFNAYVDQDALKRRIERILDEMQSSLNTDLATKEISPTPPQESPDDAMTPFFPPIRKQRREESRQSILLDLDVQVNCSRCIFSPLVSSKKFPEGRDRPQSGHIIVNALKESLADVYRLLARRLGTEPDSLIVRLAECFDEVMSVDEETVISELESHNRIRQLLVQRLDKALVMLKIEDEKPVEFLMDFTWSLGEMHREIRALAPQLRHAEFVLLAGNCNLFADCDLTTPIGHAFLGLGSLSVKVAVNYSARVINVDQVLMTSNDDEEEDELDGPLDSLTIERVRDLKQFVSLQSRVFQLTHGHRLARSSVAQMLRELCAQRGRLDINTEFRPLPSEDAFSLPTEKVFLKLPSRTLFFMRLFVREGEQRWEMKWVLPNTTLRDFQMRVARLSGVQPECQSLYYAGQCLYNFDPDVTLQQFNIRSDSELQLRRNFEITVKEAVTGAEETLRILGHLRSVAQLRLLFQSRFGVDADIVKLSVDGILLPLDGALSACGVVPGAVLTWIGVLRAHLIGAFRGDLLVYPDASVREFCEIIRAHLSNDRILLGDLKLSLCRIPDPPVRVEINNEDGSLAENGIISDFEVIVMSDK